jgi:hypothetical protein
MECIDVENLIDSTTLIIQSERDSSQMMDQPIVRNKVMLPFVNDIAPSCQDFDITRVNRNILRETQRKYSIKVRPSLGKYS